MTGRAKLRIDPIACDGRGLCAEVLPELIWMDDWGFPIIADGDVPARLRPAAGEAVRICPKLALTLDRDRGPAAAWTVDRFGGGRATTARNKPAAGTWPSQNPES